MSDRDAARTENIRHPDAADPDRDPLDLIAEEFAARCRRGETPAVTEYVTRHPEHADELRELLPAVAQMELLKKRRPTLTDPTPADDLPPDRLGDYRIVREIGRGGMGVVYEAMQETLGRRVAVKLLPARARSDPGKRDRFLREAQAAARLHHTHIVPVFGVGEADGVPYFVMPFVGGRGLDDVIAGWRRSKSGRRSSAGDGTDEHRTSHADLKPGDWHAFARIGATAARALQYAHEQGVLHRDVKPANLLLDADGHLFVADFGLAKVLDQTSLTATGDVLGTVQYMAPEGLRGEADERSDVYGLGMTLYELATGRLPFDVSNPAVLVRQIGEKEPTPPRAWDPHIPRDFETIILKAISRDPAHRYPSADDLADDLDAFLHDIPIRARRASSASRAWRWCRRNPAVAGLLAACAMLVLLIGLSVVGYAIQTERALANERQLRREAEEANRRLTENLQLSLAAFDAVFETDRPPGGPRPGGPPGPMQAADDRARMMEAVLAFFDRFAEQNQTDPRLRFDAARAYRRVGELHVRFGRREKADEAFGKAARLLAGLRAETPDEPGVRHELELLTERQKGDWKPPLGPPGPPERRPR